MVGWFDAMVRHPEISSEQICEFAGVHAMLKYRCFFTSATITGASLNKRPVRQSSGQGSESAHSNAPLIEYRGSNKHKNRPTSEQKGTLCPEWTHDTPDGGYSHDPAKHVWVKTLAHQLFASSIPPFDTKRRYATKHGIAFEAKPTDNGTWHGYPVPWEAVPPDIVNQFVDRGLVTRRQVKKHLQKEKNDLRWAMGVNIE
jgi:hypothetical protein